MQSQPLLNKGKQSIADNENKVNTTDTGQKIKTSDRGKGFTPFRVRGTVNIAQQPKNVNTNTEAFKKWFSDSKVVDENGKPLVVYHGTGAEFSEFDFDNVFGRRALFFTPNKNIAETYAKVNGGKNVMPVYLMAKKILYVDGKGNTFHMQEMPKQLREKDKQYGFTDTDEIVDLAKEKGYDGVIFKNIQDTATNKEKIFGDVYAVFNSNQIKSVDNRGTFDAENPNIYYRPADKKKLNEAIKSSIEEVRKLNKQLFNDDSLQVVRKILTPEGQEALGQYRDGMIEIVEGQADPKATYYHEAVHKYKDLFITREEQKALMQEMRKRHGDNVDLEEVLAEDFIDYANKRQGITGKLRLILERILNRIKAYLGNVDIIDSFYNDLLSGKAAKLNNINNTADTIDNAPYIVSYRGKNFNFKKLIDTITDYFDDVQNGNNPQPTVELKGVPVISKVAKLVQEKTGRNISDYKHILNKSDVSHIINDHLNKEGDITDMDIQNIPNILLNPDEVNFREASKGKSAKIIYKKHLGDGNYVYVEVVLNPENKTLSGKTFFKQTKEKPRSLRMATSEGQPPKITRKTETIPSLTKGVTEPHSPRDISKTPISVRPQPEKAAPATNRGSQSITQQDEKVKQDSENNSKFRTVPAEEEFKNSKIVNSVQRAIGAKQAQSFKIQQRWENITKKMEKQGITSYQDNVDLFNYYDNPKMWPLPKNLKNKIGQDLLNEILAFKKMMTNEQVQRGLLDNAWKDEEYMRTFVIRTDGAELTAAQANTLKKGEPWQHSMTQSQLAELRNLNKRMSAIGVDSGSSSGNLLLKNKYNVARNVRYANRRDEGYKKLGIDVKVNRNFTDVMARMVKYIYLQ